MRDKHPNRIQLSPEEKQLIEQLRQHPELRERFQSILEITARAAGPVQRADEIEELLIEQVRRLGNASMESWARRAEATLGEQLQQQDESAGGRKKKR